MRAYHETGVDEHVKVKNWPFGTPCTLLYVGDRRYPRDIVCEPKEILNFAHLLGAGETMKYLHGLQGMLDRTNGVKA